jgi:hypothetical protein
LEAEDPPVNALPPRDATQALFDSATAAVVRLRQSGREEFEAAIRPDDHTEICLRVTWQDGTAEIQAELPRGDATSLTARWQELQDRLTLHGIRLGSLQTGSSTAGSNHHRDSAPHDPSPLTGPLSALRPALTAHASPAGAAQPPASATSATQRAWERWA